MTRQAAAGLPFELFLLGVLALLWGSSYLFIKLALVEIPPLTLIASRVSIAAVFLLIVVSWRGERLPREPATWRRLLVQAFLNSIGAWTILAWGQQYVDSGLASVLNSTSPIFVFFITFSHKQTHTATQQQPQFGTSRCRWWEPSTASEADIGGQILQSNRQSFPLCFISASQPPTAPHAGRGPPSARATFFSVADNRQGPRQSDACGGIRLLPGHQPLVLEKVVDDPLGAISLSRHILTPIVAGLGCPKS